jgi:hypothetical protein
MNADEPILLNLRSSVFIGGQPYFGLLPAFRIDLAVAGFVFDFASFVVDALANRAANIDLFFGGFVIGRFPGIVLDYRFGGLCWRHRCLHCAA